MLFADLTLHWGDEQKQVCATSLNFYVHLRILDT